MSYNNQQREQHNKRDKTIMKITKMIYIKQK